MFRSTILSIAATGLISAVAAALPPQTAGGGGRATTVRSRCANCTPAADSALRAKLERLSLRMDSLRWQIDNGRMSSVERERTTTELSNTVLAFKSTLDELRLPQTTVVAYGSTEPARVVTGARAPMPAAVAMATASWKPRGYLGVTFDGQPAAEILRDGEQFIRFYQYPRIALVDPSSPAERAGILEGDTLLSLNGVDVRKEISLTQLLVPDRRITVGVRREGDSKEFRVTVREAPEYYARRATPVPRAAIAQGAPGRVEVYTQPPGAIAPTPPTPRAAPPTIFMFSEGVGMAGARLQTISEGIGKALGVKEGVFVLAVSPGPAWRAGLREGDVIVKAGGREVASVRVLQSVLNDGDGEEGVRLVILRERKERELVLHW